MDIDIARRTPPPGFDSQFLVPPQLKDDGLRRVRSLAIDVSGCCNMACRYCAEHITMPKRRSMSTNTLDAAWKFLFPNGVNAITEGREGEYLKLKMFSFHMGSGEPLLNLPILKKLAEMVGQAKSEGNKIPHVFMTTNSILLDQEVMDWLIASQWNVKISFDGPAAIHDRWRVLPGGEGTYDHAARAITYLAERMPPERLGVCAVLCLGADMAEVFAAIEKLGVQLVDIVPVATKEESFKPGPEDIENFKIFMMNYAVRFLEDKKLPPTITMFSHYVLRLMGYKLARVLCGAGRHYLGVGPEGDIYPCGRFIGLEQFNLGHVVTGVDLEAAQTFWNGVGRSYHLREACSQCWAAPLCGGPCFAVAEMFGPGNSEPLDFHCAYTLAIAEAAVFLVNQLREHNPERLLTFLPQPSDKIFEMFD